MLILKSNILKGAATIARMRMTRNNLRKLSVITLHPALKLFPKPGTNLYSLLVSIFTFFRIKEPVNNYEVNLGLSLFLDFIL